VVKVLNGVKGFSSSKDPLSGARLEYEVMGVRVLIKESIANWLELKPAAPKYGNLAQVITPLGVLSQVL